VERDIALILDEEVTCDRLLDRMHELADARVVRIELFDLYRGAPVPAGKKSMAFRVTYQDPARTLTDEEVNRVQESFLNQLLPSFDAQLR
jgi:phenylalanyl-tRNA synthetase beta chain